MKTILPILVLSLAFSFPSAQAQFVINETFSEDTVNPDNPQNIPVEGVKAAPVNLPGASWQMATGDGAYEAYLTPPATTAAACFHNVAAIALNLAGNGSYTKPKTMTVSAAMAFATDAATGTCYVGYYSKLQGPHTGNPAGNFTGLILQKDGKLQLVENGTAAGAAIPYTGKYDPTTPATVTFTVSTTNGSISNVSVSGSTSAYTFTSKAFTDAATAYLGVGSQTDGASMGYCTLLQLASGTSLPAPTPAPSSPQTNAPSGSPPAK